MDNGDSKTDKRCVIKSQWDTIIFISFLSRHTKRTLGFILKLFRFRKDWQKKHSIFHFRGRGGSTASTPLSPCVLDNVKCNTGRGPHQLTWSEQELAISKQTFHVNMPASLASVTGWSWPEQVDRTVMSLSMLLRSTLPPNSTGPSAATFPF